MPYAALLEDGEVLTKPTREALGQLAALAPRSLMIFDYEFDSLQPLARFAALESLKISNPMRLSSLSGAAQLDELRVLVLAPPHSWDGSGRCIEVESYRPLAGLTKLERLVLHAVRPQDRDLSPIAGMRHLRELELHGVPEFTVEHYARLAAALPTTAGSCLQPYVQLQGIGFCGKCSGRTVLLTGAPKRARKWLCPTCNRAKLAEHVALWETFKATAPTTR